jgi:benzoyl-CoA-dihydrodiol lyase
MGHDTATASHPPIRFETHPDRYQHWQLTFEGAIARLSMNVKEEGGMRPGYPLKLNSYDLGVDIELADAVQRIRFEHPEVRTVIVSSTKDRVFCSGANIYMLGMSTHSFKVNFCKYTNETRLYIEDASAESGIKFLCAVNGPCAGGGYELALACDEIILQDDGSSAVSLPEVPLLAVLPGTGGLTRVVDKRKVRRDLADVFSTLAEGVRGQRAVQWRLVDSSVPRSKFNEAVNHRAKALAETSKRVAGDIAALPLEPLGAKYSEHGAEYEYVSLKVDADARVATLTVRAPKSAQPEDAKGFRAAGCSLWSLKAFREIDDALLQLRFNFNTVGLVVVRTEGDAAAVLQADHALLANQHHWLGREVLLHMKRVMKRLDQTARSVFALVDDGSCFAGSLFELAIGADRIYMKDDPDAAKPITVQLSPMNHGPLPMANGLTRLATRFLYDPQIPARLRENTEAIEASGAAKLGLATFTPDAIDWDDEVRVAIEERASLSPDALTGMEASLRFAGPETLETKIFGRLSAWQNWIFIRPNATGKRGALTMYGQPERPEFDWTRT